MPPGTSILNLGEGRELYIASIECLTANSTSGVISITNHCSSVASAIIMPTIGYYAYNIGIMIALIGLVTSFLMVILFVRD